MQRLFSLNDFVTSLLHESQGHSPTERQGIIMKFIRWILGKIILLLNAVFSPRGVKRSAEAQKSVDDKAQNYALYQFEACPFCVKVRRAMKRQSVNIELRDAKNDPVHREALEQGGGRVKVPCLRIEKDGETQWLYESSDIVAYIEKEFA